MMLDLKTRPSVPQLIAAAKPPPDDDFGKLADTARLFLKRRFKLALALMVLGLIASAVYLKAAPPSYTAVAVIEVANREGRYLQQQATLTDLPADLERNAALAKSWTIADIVSQKLRLAEDTEFAAHPSPLVLQLRRLWSGGPVDPGVLLARTTVSSVLSRTRVTPDGSGTSFSISFTSRDPEKAADIANAIAETFIAIKNEADSQIHKQAGDWLVGQSEDLAKRAADAAAAVSDFVKANNLILIDGKPLDQKNLEDINKRVEEAKSKVNDAQHKLDKVNASLKAAADRDILEVTSSEEILAVTAIAKARDRYTDLSNQLRSLQQDYGKDSQKLRQVMAATKAEILAELGRLQENARSDYQLASQHYNELVAEQESFVAASHRAIYLGSQLKALQQTEQNYRTLYQNFLQHSAESVQELSFPVRAVRITERATAPLDKSWPKPLIVVAGGAVGGLLLGFAFGALRDFTDGVFRTASQFESVTQLKCLGLVPFAKTSKIPSGSPALSPGLAERLLRMQGAPVWTKVKTAPNSRFVSELLAVRLGLRNAAILQNARVFGFTSSIAGEGKSALVASLGVLMAQSGHRVVVVDLDFRNPTLTDLLAPGSRVGLSEVLLGRRALEDVLVNDPLLDLAIAPGAGAMNIMQTVELLTSAKMRECMAKLREAYEIVLVDLPPLVPITDVRATAEIIDSYVLVVEWAKTHIALVKRALESNPEVAAKLAGGVLNKVQFDLLPKYDALATSYYLRPEFSRYLDRE